MVIIVNYVRNKYYTFILFLIAVYTILYTFLIFGIRSKYCDFTKKAKFIFENKNYHFPLKENIRLMMFD